MQRSNTSNFIHVELERNQYDYIYCDEKNRIHILIPLTSAIPAGKNIVLAGDNTCQILSELKKSIGLKPGSPSIKDSLNNYIKDLAFDIWAMEDELNSTQKEIPQNLKDKKERLEQLYYGQEIVEATLDYLRESLAETSMSYGQFPPEVLKLFSIDNQNVVRVELSPEKEDNVTAFTQDIVLFSALRGDERFQGLGESLRQRFSQNGFFESKPKKTQKDILIENCAKAYFSKYPSEPKITNDDSLDNLKNIIIQEYNKMTGKNIPLADLNTLSNGYTKANWDTFTEILAVFNYDGDPIEEAIPTILSSTIPEYFNALSGGISPLSELYSQCKAELLSVNCQLFLSMINAYCYSKWDNKNNFGEIIEKNSLHEGLAIDIELAIRDGSLIEDAILNFFSLNHALFGLDKAPSSSDKEALKDGFREYYQAVQLDSTSHFDEFVLCLPEKKTEGGCGYIHHSKIVFPFSKVLEQSEKFKSLYQKYFMGESPRLSSKISPNLYRLPSINPVGNETKTNVERIDIKGLLDKKKYTEAYFINLLIKPLVLESKDEFENKTSKLPTRLYQFISPEQQELIKNDNRRNWLNIFNGVIANLSPEEIEIFCNTWKLPIVMHIDAGMFDVICSAVIEEDTHKNPLLGLYGATKLQTALKLLLKGKNIVENIVVRPNDLGGYNVLGRDNAKLKVFLMPIYNKARCFVHIPRGVAKSIYRLAQMKHPNNAQLWIQTTKPSFMDSMEMKKMESWELRQYMKTIYDEDTGKQTASLIVQSLETIHFPISLKIEPNGFNGYKARVKNQKERKLVEAELQAIYEPYYQQQPAIELTPKDCRKIIRKAKVGLCGNTPAAAMRNALARAFGYRNLNLIVHSMDFRMENGQIFVRCVIDKSPSQNELLMDEGDFGKLKDIIDCPAFVLHPSKDPQFKNNILTNDTSELESFERRFDYQIDLDEAKEEILCASASEDDEFILLPFYGAERILEAISLLISRLKLKKYGQISVVPNGNSYTLYIEKEGDYIMISEWINQYELPIMHATRSIATTLYLEAKNKNKSGITFLEEICRTKLRLTEEELEGLEIKYNTLKAFNGYIISGKFPVLKKIKALHRKRFKGLPAIQLTAEQCEKWCEKAGINIKNNGLRNAMVQVIEYWPPYDYRDVPTSFLEIKDDNSVRMVVEPGDKGIKKIAWILGINDPESLRAKEHPADSEERALDAERDIEPETKQNEIKSHSSWSLSSSSCSSSSSTPSSIATTQKESTLLSSSSSTFSSSSVSSTGIFSNTASSPNSIATNHYFPVDANFSDEKWPVQFKFSSLKVATYLCIQLQGLNPLGGAIELLPDEQAIRFSSASCKRDSALYFFLNCFEYGNRDIQATVNDFIKNIRYMYGSTPTSLFDFDQIRIERCQNAWKIISKANNSINGFKFITNKNSYNNGM